MSAFRAHKVVAALPGSLEASTLYAVRSGAGFDLHLTNESGQIVAYPLNQPGGSDQADPSIASVLRDDFRAGSTETGEIGELGWSFGNGSVAIPNAEAGRPGLIRRTSSTTNLQINVLTPYGSNIPTFRFDEFDRQTWIVRLESIAADFNIVFGAIAGASTIDGGAHAIRIEKLAADSTWFFACRNNNAQTRVNSGVAVSTGWVKLMLRRINAAQVGFSIDNGAEVVMNTSIPDAADTLFPANLIQPTATNARSFLLDFWSERLLPLAR